MSNTSQNATDSDLAVAQAVATAVREFGPSASTEPRRVQGLISDVLGPAARTRRAEIDAVVMAAEEQIPDDLMARRIGVGEALDRLLDRGLGRDLAQFAVEVWQFAFGLLDPSRPAPSLSKRLTEPTPIPEPAPTETARFDPRFLAASLRAEEPAAPEAPANHRGRWIAVAAIVGALALVGGILAVVMGGAGRPHITVTPPPAQVPRLVFAEEATAFGTAARIWTTSGENLVGKVKLTNTGSSDASVHHVEVLPKSLVADAAAITSDPAHVVIKSDPVIAWDLTIPAGSSETVTYRFKPTKRVTKSRLGTWRDDRAKAAAAFTAESSRPPALTISEPAEGATVATTFVVAGSTDPGATVSVAGAAVTVNPDGTWSHQVAGTTTVVVTASSPYGVTTELTRHVQFPAPTPQVPQTPTPETPGPTTTPKPKRQPATKLCPNGTRVATAASCPTPPAAVTPPPQTPVAPQPPDPTVTCWNGTVVGAGSQCPPRPISITINGPNEIFSDGACGHNYSITATGFTPADVDWPGSGPYDGKTAAVLRFNRPSDADFAYTTTFTVTATAPDGRTATATKSVHVITAPPSGCG